MGDRLGDVVARLYVVLPEEFVAVRDEEVARARASGNRELAEQIAKLRRPTVAAWLVNLLVHQRPDLIAELLALGEQLRSAQRELRGADLRELSVRRRDTVAALARESVALAASAGRAAVDKLPMTEVETTLAAVLADADVAAEVRAGRLIRSLAYAGFGETPRPQLRLLQGGAADGEAARAAKGTKLGRPADDDPPASGGGAAKSDRPVKRRQSDEEAAQRRAAEARRRAEEQRKEEERAARVARTEAVKAARHDLMAGSQQLAEARAARTVAKKALVEAQRALNDAEAAMEAAQARIDDAKRRLR